MAYYDFNKNKGFVTVSNSILRTKKLSLADKGLIALMMSFPKPPDYRITISGLAKYCGESEDTISKRVKELQTAGFVKRTRINDSNGRLCYIYEINQEPVYKVDAATLSFGKPNPEKPEKEQPPPEKSVPVEPTSEKSAPVEPSPEKPAPVEPSPEKPVLVEPPTEKPYKDNLRTRR